MNVYRIVIINNKTNEPETIMEMSRPRFTKREYDVMLQEMFMLAAESIDYQHLTAEIYCNGIQVHSIHCDTVVDGSRITAVVHMGYTRFIRNMAIAY